MALQRGWGSAPVSKDRPRGGAPLQPWLPALQGLGSLAGLSQPWRQHRQLHVAAVTVAVTPWQLSQGTGCEAIFYHVSLYKDHARPGT